MTVPSSATPYEYPPEEAIERAKILTAPDAPGFDKPWALAIMRGMLTALDGWSPVGYAPSTASSAVRRIPEGWPLPTQDQAMGGWCFNFDWLTELSKKAEEICGEELNQEAIEAVLLAAKTSLASSNTESKPERKHRARVDARGWWRIGPVRIEPKTGENPADREKLAMRLEAFLNGETCVASAKTRGSE